MNSNQVGNMSATNVPRGKTAYKLLQGPTHRGLGAVGLGNINLKTGEFWGILISGAIVGVMTVTLFNRYYR